MRHLLRSAGTWLLAAATALSLSTAQAQTAAPWEAMRQANGRDEVNTWVRPVNGLDVKAFRGVTELKANAWTVLALLSDTRNLATWIFQGHTSEHVEGTPLEQARLRFKGVWPANDRDVFIRTAVNQLPSGVIVVDSTNVADQPTQDCCVRIPLLHNVFRLTPLKGGWTRVEFETLIDLGGQVPAWLANLVSTKAPLLTLQNMQQQVKKPAYQGKTATDLPTFYHHGGTFVLPEDHLKAGDS
jgi:hypothetical protein